MYTAGHRSLLLHLHHQPTGLFFFTITSYSSSSPNIVYSIEQNISECCACILFISHTHIARSIRIYTPISSDSYSSPFLFPIPLVCSIVCPFASRKFCDRISRCHRYHSLSLSLSLPISIRVCVCECTFLNNFNRKASSACASLYIFLSAGCVYTHTHCMYAISNLYMNLPLKLVLGLPLTCHLCSCLLT